MHRIPSQLNHISHCARLIEVQIHAFLVEDAKNNCSSKREALANLINLGTTKALESADSLLVDAHHTMNDGRLLALNLVDHDIACPYWRVPIVEEQDVSSMDSGRHGLAVVVST